MKKIAFQTVMSFCLLISLKAYSQVTVPTNVSSAFTEFVGWSGIGTSKPLAIRNSFTGQPINFFTAATQRMTITGTTGFVGIGNNFTAPVSMLHLHDGSSSTFQMTNVFTGPTATSGFRIVVAGLTVRLQQQEAAPFYFFAGGSTFASERMVIIGTAGPTQGFVGIGTNFINPQYRLDVHDNINITPNFNLNFLNEGYRIGGNLVLYLPNDNAGDNNTFVGRSGNNTAIPGTNNTYLGFGAGNASNAGSNNCTMMGVNAGLANVAFGSTFIGFEAGFSNDLGDLNTFVGTGAGRSSITVAASGNAFFGGNAGFGNTFGASNVFIGQGAGVSNTIGNLNTIVGQGANVGVNNLTNASGLGNGAIVMTSSTMILGDNSVNVGIGLSAFVPGPRAKIEVRQLSTTSATNTKTILATNSDQSGGCVIAINNGIGGTSTNPEIGGWFQTPPNQYALVVPKGGGFVSIGQTTTITPSTTWNSFLPNTSGATVEIGGTLFLNGMQVIASDASLKTNVTPISNAMTIVNNLHGVSFNWIPSQISDTVMNGIHYGFIAQSVDSVLPNLVHTGSNGIKSVSYIELIPYLSEALKQEHIRNDSLENRLNNLEAAIVACCSSNERIQNPASQEVNLISGKAILYQNFPNPAGTETDINYFLPDNSVDAEMVFFNMSGNEIRRVVIENKGNAKLHVSTQDLASGIYTYSLIVNGNVVSTLRMIKAK